MLYKYKKLDYLDDFGLEAIQNDLQLELMEYAVLNAKEKVAALDKAIGRYCYILSLSKDFILSYKFKINKTKLEKGIFSAQIKIKEAETIKKDLLEAEEYCSYLKV
jgi:hypothetical protein